MARLFEPLRLRDATFRNRIFVSPMCMYSATDGVPNDWHLVHLGSRAVGGAALVIAEATGVSPEGRISPGDTGLWNGAQVDAFRRIAAFVSAQGAVPGLQLAHAGRKASTHAPWRGGGPLAADEGAWTTLAPSPVAFDTGAPAPREMTPADMDRVTDEFAAAARRAADAGFGVVEVHAAHGYLLHEFLSPLSNRRKDGLGGPLENRMRFPLRVVGAVREAFPAGRPVFVRISATDWADGGWDLAQSIVFARCLKELGVDLVDCSSGGLVPYAKVAVAPGYQVPFAEAIRRDTGIPTAAVGMITEPRQAEEILAKGRADAIVMARAFLRDPYWPLHAAKDLGADVEWPAQYRRARP
ncbi:MAG TPA: NADH:flavin oxidoreductase/NADH oxidase [Thermoanaerobaculia bacterium]|jgi:2,4-dienoyl-CoA reductase-like NADH-dependent reductase (Old Yellow Enzyme family)